MRIRLESKEKEFEAFTISIDVDTEMEAKNLLYLFGKGTSYTTKDMCKEYRKICERQGARLCEDD